MFPKSHSNLTFSHKRTISLDQTYSCPKCSIGTISNYGHGEVLHCNECQHKFVPLNSSKLLYPAIDPGFKIAPTYWYDGKDWRFAGTSASFTHVLILTIIAILPYLVLDYLICQNIWLNRPSWYSNELTFGLVFLTEFVLFKMFIWDGRIIIDQKRKAKSK